ncbi:MAG: McrB family protein [Lachnospirales bacterium]
MAIIDSRSDAKFDALIRTNKADSLMSFIMATYNVKKTTDKKEEVALRLKSAYELFRENVKGSNSGAGSYGQGDRDIIDQFESHYTMGYEMGIWQDSDFTLNPLAVEVANYNITVSEYIGVVFTNLFTYYDVNGEIKYHHFLFEILKKAKIEGVLENKIPKSLIVETLPISKAVEQGNMIFNYLISTDIFEYIDKDNFSLSLKWKDRCDALLTACNLEYQSIEQQYAIEMAKDKKKYADYVTRRCNVHEKIDSITKTLNNQDISLVDESKRLTTGENILLYGVPGSGKSWTIEHEYCENEKLMERLVFHPDYMYSDFVGQILPKVVKGEDGTEKVRYEFTPGPFTKILKRAYQDPTNAYYLVIEEINRGNAPAIFGEIFQLLDRVDEDKTSEYNVLLRKCTSEYGITNANVAGVVYGDEDRKIRIPSNLSIVGTMNTSDQNVFTLDTAFQRRWIMRMIPNSFKNHKFAENTILDTRISWRQFCEAINEEILRKNNIMSSEDKRLGAYFVSADDLSLVDIPNTSPIEQKRAEHHNSRFAEKVLKYLWDDAFKFSHADTFDNKKYKSLEMIIDGFMSTTGPDRFRVFNKNLKSMIIDGVGEGDNIVSEDEE